MDSYSLEALPKYVSIWLTEIFRGFPKYLGAKIGDKGKI